MTQSMSGNNADWGDMVLPGVYMIQRTAKSALTTETVQADGTVNLELVHLEIEEAEKHIELLDKSNREIALYLKEKREGSCDGEGDAGVTSMAALADGGVEEEEDDAVFREALEENVLVIARKKREVELLRALLGGQRCGCSHAHAHPHAPPPPPAVEPNAETRITL